MAEEWTGRRDERMGIGGREEGMDEIEGWRDEEMERK